MEELLKKVEDVVKKLESDKDLMAKFKADPIATIEGLAGIDIPEEEVKKVVELVKGKIGVDGVAGALKGLLGK
ncbi:MAG: hypothetical protein PHE06_10315 [Lachnospiraceae bacterium]|nr:hypothetical protein [Lachnospiraceae bacterium]MDD3796342.1 hypothetical protein [Lachnospiraceae bacterium]